VLEGLREFREHLGGELTISLLERPGRARDVHEMDAARVGRCIQWLTDRYRDAA
jgi:3-dehydroquinate synthase